MKILAVDTALGACSAAILDGETIAAHRWMVMVRGHAEALAPMVQQILEEAGLGFSAFDRLGVTTGPGTFTGQRVGLAFMRGLRLALGRPLVGVTTLEAMAAAVKEETEAHPIAVVHEAKRGEVYGALFDGATPVIPVKLAEFEAIMTEIDAHLDARSAPDLTIAGTAAEAAAQWFGARGRNVSLSAIRQPDARYVARLAALGAETEGAAKPLYLRPPDAKLSASAIRLRPASPSDRDLLAALNAANLPEKWGAEFFGGVLESRGGFGFLAEANGTAVGFVVVRTMADEAEVLAIAVSEPHRRNGIARRLLQEAAARAIGQGADKLYLEVAANNKAARKLYESMGFRSAGWRRRYYTDGQDALLLQASLVPAPAGLGNLAKVD